MMNNGTKCKHWKFSFEELKDIVQEQKDSSAGDRYAALQFDQRLELTVGTLYNRKEAARVERLIKNAKFWHADADIHTLYYQGRNLNKNQILSLAEGSYFTSNKNIVINGQAGSGKTHLACALGKEACLHLYRTRYIKVAEIREQLNFTEQKGIGLSRKITCLGNYQLLIIDDWLQELPTDREVNYFFELLEKRYNLWPTIFCTQYKMEDWHFRLGGGALADTICDRIVRGVEVINLGDFNMRKFLSRNVS